MSPIHSLLLSLPIACSPPLSDYTLRLSPVLLESQRDAVLSLDPDIFIRIVAPDDTETLHYAGAAADGGALTIDALPPLVVGTTVALIAVHPNGPTDVWEREITIAYGEVVIEKELALGEQEVTLEVPMPRVDDVGKRGALKGVQRKLGGALALVPGGAVYLFGGGNPDETERIDSPNLGNPILLSSDTVLKATRSLEGWSDFEEVGKIEPFESALGFPGSPPTVPGDRRSGMTATLVNTQDTDAILVVGGRYTDFPAYFSDGWFLWDPQTESIIDKGNILTERSDHLALPLGPSRVLVFGGQLAANDGALEYEIWQGQGRKSEIGLENLTLDLGGLYAMATTDGATVVICGGYKVDPYVTEGHAWVAKSGCYRFAATGEVTPIKALPIPIGAGAIAPLPDGGLLVSGGATEGFVEDEEGGAVNIGSALSVPATDQSYRWDPATNTWSEVGNLVYARANHKMVLLSTGRVLVIGGTESANAFLGPLGAPQDCTEIFNPSTNTFAAGTCSDVGKGAFPEVADDYVSEVAVFEGFGYNVNELIGGGNYGSIGRLPEP